MNTKRNSSRTNCSEWNWSDTNRIVFKMAGRIAVMSGPGSLHHWDDGHGCLVPSLPVGNLNDEIERLTKQARNLFPAGIPHLHIVHVDSDPKRYAIFFAAQELQPDKYWARA